MYPSPDAPVLLLEAPSELEKQIGVARRAVTASYLDARAQVQGVISRWIDVEQAVEHRVKSLIAPDEPLTPGVLYVGVATLTGSVLARNRMILTRLLLPPTLLLLSFRHFLPKTAHNVSDYCGSLEDTYFPRLAQAHETAKAHSAMTWERIKDVSVAGREATVSGVETMLVRIEEATGLKLKEALGYGQGVVRAVENQTKAAAKIVQQKTEAATDVIVKKTEAAKEAIEHKAEAAKEVAEHKAENNSVVSEPKVEEPPTRLV
ncbi:uncharacterized protein LAESUDRAFT_737684 [Laetiporus sulphureus 93-53]|uniref:MICOS complex subunit n=1 Tax=Laetiporus sulphureus 93-53 TaxID=1314785 RepID=A0A165DLT4_9APHY|nr:uncharacterized protein LAESUDRAFT_737684 [Laetiporus sulphureus 93-53]KZT05163.1 hypothetical protein LAESUDRAFT_737684 [Laetiporus sulphureus 93-53]